MVLSAGADILRGGSSSFQSVVICGRPLGDLWIKVVARLRLRLGGATNGRGFMGGRGAPLAGRSVDEKPSAVYLRLRLGRPAYLYAGYDAPIPMG